MGHLQLSQVKSPLLYSAFNNTDRVKAALQYSIGKVVCNNANSKHSNKWAETKEYHYYPGSPFTSSLGEPEELYYLNMSCLISISKAKWLSSIIKTNCDNYCLITHLRIHVDMKFGSIKQLLSKELANNASIRIKTQAEFQIKTSSPRSQQPLEHTKLKLNAKQTGTSAHFINGPPDTADI